MTLRGQCGNYTTLLPLCEHCVEDPAEKGGAHKRISIRRGRRPTRLVAPAVCLVARLAERVLERIGLLPFARGELLVALPFGIELRLARLGRAEACGGLHGGAVRNRLAVE